MSTVEVKWIDSQLMVGVDSYGHPLITGSWPEKDPEWSALKPSDLLLLSAASCSGYDVIMILKKQREPIEGLEVICTAEQEAVPPFKFSKLHLHYRVKGNVSLENIGRAIKLSEEKYCSVINTLKPTVEISSDYEIVC